MAHGAYYGPAWGVEFRTRAELMGVLHTQATANETLASLIVRAVEEKLTATEIPGTIEPE